MGLGITSVQNILEMWQQGNLKNIGICDCGHANTSSNQSKLIRGKL